MPAFEIKVTLTDLPDILGAMREWLDHHRTIISHFRSESDAIGMVTINVGFTAIDDADAFQQRFDTAIRTRDSKDGIDGDSRL